MKLCLKCTHKTRNKSICKTCIHQQRLEKELQETCAMPDVESLCIRCGNVNPLLHPCEYCQDDLDALALL
jgi:RecJ-like exonuclease